MARVRAGELELFYETAGAGEPVPMLMGLGGGHHAWDLVRPELARYRLVLPDNRAAGASDESSGPYTLDDMASDALAVMDALGIERFHVIGASMGGAIAQRLALLAPTRVATLVLLCTWGRTDPFLAAILESWRLMAERLSPEALHGAGPPLPGEAPARLTRLSGARQRPDEEAVGGDRACDGEQRPEPARYLRLRALARGATGDDHALGMGERLAQLERVLGTVPRVALERVQDDLLEGRRDLGTQASRRRRVVVQLGAHRRVDVVALERHLAGQHLVEDDAQAVEIAAGVSPLPLHLLGGHVVRGADRLGQPRPRHLPERRVERDAEVDELHAAVRRDHDVLGLEVAVGDAVIVQVDERVGDLDREPGRGRDGEAALAPQAVAEQLPLDVLHRQVEAALLARAEDLDHGGMIQALPDLLFATEALVEDNVARVLEMRHLERDRVPVVEITRPEDGGHPAARDD